MVDYCRFSTLSTNKSLDSSSDTDAINNHNGSSNFFPSLLLPYSQFIDGNSQGSVTNAFITSTNVEQTHFEEEKLRVQIKDKKDQSANASAEVKTCLKSFICRRLQKEGKLGNQESIDMLRRFPSAPTLVNSSFESNTYKVRSDLRQSILHRHRYMTPMLDKRYLIRSTNSAEKQKHAIRPMPKILFDSSATQMHRTDQLCINFNDLQQKLYSCHSTGSISGTSDSRQNNFNSNQSHTTILGPKYFVAEEENEALLAKELQETKIQSPCNNRSLIHHSQPQIFNYDSSINNSNSFNDCSPFYSKSLSSLSIITSTIDKNLPKNLSNSMPMRFTTGIAYDHDTLKHECYCKNTDLHLENPHRLLVIYEQLKHCHLLDECEIISNHCATIDTLTDCHDPNHVYLYGCDQRQRIQQSIIVLTQRFNSIVQLPCGGVGIHDDTDTIWNELYTARACRLAIGNTIELAKYVFDEKLKNGFALVRPPGHHATQKPLGFCYFNTIAITAKYLKKHRNVERIAIVDWDIHHGNGTQDLTYDDPNILYISLHRYDNGTYFPGGGRIEECGCDNGLGKNVNIAFSSEQQIMMTDVEYLAAFRSIVMPILEQFQPQIILVSSGFDGCIGHSHPLGGYELTPTCFAYMTNHLRKLANGKIVLVLEGGYELNALAECGKLCVEALLGRQMPSFARKTLETKPNLYAINNLKRVVEVQRMYSNIREDVEDAT